MHKRIWRIAEATIADALADLSAGKRDNSSSCWVASRVGCLTLPITQRRHPAPWTPRGNEAEPRSAVPRRSALEDKVIVS